MESFIILLIEEEKELEIFLELFGKNENSTLEDMEILWFKMKKIKFIKCKHLPHFLPKLRKSKY